MNNTIIAVAEKLGASIVVTGSKTEISVEGYSFRFFAETEVWMWLDKEAKKWTRTSGSVVERILQEVLRTRLVSQVAEEEEVKLVEDTGKSMETAWQAMDLGGYLSKEVEPSDVAGLMTWTLANGWVVIYAKTSDQWRYSTTPGMKPVRAPAQTILNRLIEERHVEEESKEVKRMEPEPLKFEKLVEQAQMLADTTGTPHYVWGGMTVDTDEKGVEKEKPVHTVSSDMGLASTMKMLAECKPALKPELVKLFGLKEESVEERLKKLCIIERKKGVDKNEPPRMPYFMEFKHAGIVFDGKTMFRSDGEYCEVSMLLEFLMPCKYIEFSSKEPDAMLEIVANGLVYKGEKFRVLFGYIRDDGGKVFLVPEGADVKDLKDIGISVEIGKDMEKCLKAGKYINRSVAPTWKHFFATPLHWDEAGQVGTFSTRKGEKFTVKYVELDPNLYSKEKIAQMDGSGLFSSRFIQIADLKGGRKGKLGDAYQFTADSPFVGMGKGNGQCIPWLQYDLVIFGAKKLVKTKVFYFGCFGKLKAGRPRTDMQAWDNFRYERTGMADYLAKAFRQEMWEACQDEEKMRRMLLKHIDVQDEDVPYYNGAGSTVDYTAWVLMEALVNGWSPLRHPGLFRRAYLYLLHKVEQMELGRIPMTPVAKYGYVLADPFIFDNLGMPTRKSFIGEGECVMPDIDEGLGVVCYRQPSENQNAHCFLKNIFRNRYKAFKGKGIILLGDGADVVLGRLGGGDLDDRFVVVHDQYWVKMFHELDKFPYPETEKYEKGGGGKSTLWGEDEESNSYRLPGPDRAYYNNLHLIYQAQKAKRSGVGIGPVVNMIMIDNRLSNPVDKAYMLTQLDALIVRYTKTGNTAHLNSVLTIKEWLVKRTPYQGAKLATNLEHVIDGTVLDSGLLVVLGNVTSAVSQFHNGFDAEKGRDYAGGIDKEGTLIYPSWGFDVKKPKDVPRIPESKRDKKDFIVLDTTMCKSLRDLRQRRAMFQDRLVQLEWALVARYDEVWDSLFPDDSEIMVLAGTNRNRKKDDEPGCYQVWNNVWKNYLGGGAVLSEETRTKARKEAEKAVDAFLAKFLKPNKKGVVRYNTVEAIAVALYKHLYATQHPDAPIQEEGENAGKRRAFPDAVLWTHLLGNCLIQSSRKKVSMADPERKGKRIIRPVAGLYVPVQLEKDIMGELGDSSVKVLVKEMGLVYRISNNQWLGRVPIDIEGEGIKEGEYTMNGGLICLRLPHKGLLPVKNEEMEVPDQAE
jgi:hypothetical protein